MGSIEANGTDSFRVVCLLASAGGLAPLKAFFERVPITTGMAYLVLQHHSPDQPRLLPEILQQHATIPVRLANKGDLVLPNQALVMTSGMTLAIAEGQLRVMMEEAATTAELPGDKLFESAAAWLGERAVGVVLSGSAFDGAAGLTAIQAHGGLTLVQEPTTTLHDSMPQHAIDEGAVDGVFPAEQLPERIIHENDTHPLPRTEVNLQEVEAICASLAERKGHDFSQYKLGTLLRRIQRRMQATGSRTHKDYLAVLDSSADEMNALLKDLLISVTEFFRDPDAFDGLMNLVVTELLNDSEDPFRIWVPGCASGEEAYSLAILVREKLEAVNLPRPVQIFATDIDAPALRQAKSGRYSGETLRNVSEERRQRFFNKDEDCYKVVKELRDMCFFSSHNILRDPPFSSMHLISCRNLLIYMQSNLQRKLIPLFHFALKPKGLLFLGRAEGLASNPALFENADKASRVYRRLDGDSRRLVEFPVEGRGPQHQGKGQSTQDLERQTAPISPFGLFERMLLDEYLPASAIINELGDVLFWRGRIGQFLQIVPGPPSTNLLKNTSGVLHRELHRLLTRISGAQGEEGQAVLFNDFSLGQKRLRLTVRFIPGLGREARVYACVIQSDDIAESVAAPPPLTDMDQPLLDQIDIELRAARMEQQRLVEELESTNEELQSTNEELLSANEELQSSQEELRSVNEELRTLNSELNQKVGDLNESNSDLQNLMAATEIATIFLDVDLGITRFTPAATELFGLIEGDKGRPIGDLVPRFTGIDLPAAAWKVLASGTMLESQATDLDGRKHYIVRLLPYRSLDQIVSGVVVTFVDATEIRLAQQQAMDSEAMFRNLFKNMVNGFAHCRMRFEGESPVDFLYLKVNQAFEIQTGLMGVTGRWVSEVIPGIREQDPQLFDFLGQVAHTGQSGRLETFISAMDGWFDISAYSPQKDEFVAVLDVITTRKRAEMATAHLAAIVESSDDAIISKSLGGIITSWNAAASRMYGYLPEEAIGQPINITIPPERQSEEPEIINRIIRGEKFEHFETIRCKKDGTHFDVSLTISPIKDAQGAIIGISKVVRDITQRKRIEEKVWTSRAMFIAAIDSMTDPLFIVDSKGQFIEFNDAFAKFYRFGSKEDCSKSSDELASLLEVSYPTGEPLPYDQWPARRALRGETVTGAIYNIRRKDLDETWVGSFNFAPIRGEKADIVGAVILAHDITERLRMESERAKFDTELQQLQKMESMGILAGGVAHDMNNVLGAILSLASAHLATEPREGQTYGTFETIRDAATRGGDMVKRLLAFARQGTVVRERLDLNALVLEEVRLLERTTFARIRIEMDLAPDLHLIHGDASALTHAIMNLCVNAVDAMPEGGTLTFRTHNLGRDQVEVVVEDTGSGMTKEVLARALDPFYTTKDVGKGTGLGLPLVFTMVKNHGGLLTIASEPGKGTQVKMSFPASMTDDLATEHAAQLSIEPAPIALKVLLVDDDELIRKTTGMLVEILGHSVASTSSGEEAIKLVEQGFRPEAIILDMNMPGLGGKGTLPRLRRLCPDVPILLVTGRADQDALDLVAAFPSVTLLAKPFSIGELQRNLIEVMRKG